MPTYDYRCTACGVIFEKFSKMSDPSVTACQSCGSDAERVISGGSFVFKGSGFYITDYKKPASSADSGSTSN
ncbi:MAG: zinc ribbon domain-containing protein [Bacteroidetes bacterium]|nr:zinc ribbon domain-containing protein [Bacteroidota bacterium]